MDFEAIDVETYEFDVVRKGYDRLQVEDFLNKVSKSMARLDERRKLAEVRTDQAERELREVRTRADTTIQETFAERARIIASAGKEAEVADSNQPSAYAADRAKFEAHQIISQATDHATSIHAEAEAVLAGALSTSARINDERDDLLGSVSAERDNLIAEAAAEADAIRASAREEARKIEADATERAEKVRRRAESDAADLLDNARSRSLEITTLAETRLAGVQPSATGSTAEPAATERTAGDLLLEPVEADGTDADVGEGERISVDLRDDPAAQELQPTEAEPRASRYQSRSANLPSLGREAGSVIGSLEHLRKSDD